MNHFTAYSFVDQCEGNIFTWLWHELNQWFSELWRKMWTYRPFGTWIWRQWQYVCFPTKQAPVQLEIYFSIIQIYANPDSKFVGQLGAHMGPVSPMWAPCRPHEHRYQGPWTRNKASDYFNRQQSVWNFSTVSKFWSSLSHTSSTMVHKIWLAWNISILKISKNKTT